MWRTAVTEDYKSDFTTVALSVAEVTTNQVLGPEGVAGALLGDWIALTTPGTAEQTH